MTSRREAKAQTKQRLLDAMLAILHESGPLALTTGRIAERAGLAQPTFYVHFPDLDRAMEMAADEAGARLIRIVATQRTAVDGETQRLPGGRLRLAFRAALEGFSADRQTTELFLRHRRDTASPFAARFRAALAVGREQLVEMLSKGRIASPELVASLILGMVTATVEGVFDGRVTDREMAVDRLVVATRALLAPAGSTHGAT
jgi:AcrR family transcriptional regulator